MVARIFTTSPICVFLHPFPLYIHMWKNAQKMAQKVHLTLPQTNRTDITPENWWLGDKPFLLGPGLFFTGYVRFREGKENDSAFRLLAFKRFFWWMFTEILSRFFSQTIQADTSGVWRVEGPKVANASDFCRKAGIHREHMGNLWGDMGIQGMYKVGPNHL